MFAYILQVRATANDETDEFFRRFTEEPGLIHAFDMYRLDDPEENVVVAVWETREAAERYLTESALRKEVDQTLPEVTRTKYEVRASK
jgi:heme-degrading monooxygenase HmoA